MATKRVNANLEVAGEVTAAGENISQKIGFLEHLLPDPPMPMNGIELEAGQVTDLVMCQPQGFYQCGEIVLPKHMLISFIWRRRKIHP